MEENDIQTVSHDESSLENDSNTLYELAESYYCGKGVKQDFSKAIDYYKKAADLCNSEAMQSLGQCYENGVGVKKDYLEAAKWYRRAKEQRDSHLNSNEIFNHRNEEKYHFFSADELVPDSIDEEVDRQEYLEWLEHHIKQVHENNESYIDGLKSSANMGDLDAQIELGDIYSGSFYWEYELCEEEYEIDLNSVAPDKNESLHWYEMALKQEKNIKILKRIAHLFYDIRENDEGNYWYKRLAYRGDSEGQMMLGDYYHDRHDYVRAAKWYQRSADQGLAIAQYKLGNYLIGYLSTFCNNIDLDVGDNSSFLSDIIKQEYDKAFDLYEKAAKQNLVLAQYKLGNCYCQGLGTKKDIVQAINWWEKAAKHGSKDAARALADYYHGLQDDIKERFWRNKSYCDH